MTRRQAWGGIGLALGVGLLVFWLVSHRDSATVSPSAETSPRSRAAPFDLRLFEDERFEATIRLLVRDGEGRPIAGARVIPDDDTPGGLTDETGRWSVQWVSPRSLHSVEVEASGFARARRPVELLARHNELEVTLEPERRLTVHIEGPGPFVAPLTLTVSAGRFQHSRPLDAPGTFALVGLPQSPLTVALFEATVVRPLLSQDVGLETDMVTLSVEPRRLEVWLDPPPDDPSSFSFAELVDVRCTGAPRMLVESRLVGNGEAQLARLEYAPRGPCVIARAHPDARWQIDERYETATLSPPGSVTLHRR